MLQILRAYADHVTNQLIHDLVDVGRCCIGMMLSGGRSNALRDKLTT